jgi:short-subunit dehydrogenase
MGKQLAIVTGASSGIGYNLAKVFAENEFDLVVASAGERLDSAERDFRALGVNVTAIQADLASFDGVEQFWS